ncbi:peptidase T [Abyssisolibacter fermentans]|uniref:peptidase T n=1 Tax=Abyssisolibacter fermentans TaxID=1766203 RepID=UPI00082CE5FD|nr:peptidase T [Abyssisolibacter fermentans]
MTNVAKRFLKYAKIDTQSDENSKTCPSTQKQFNLANELVKELQELNLQDISVDENGYVMAMLPSNSNEKLPSIGFIAHMDTSPDMSGANVKPQIIEGYDGEDIILNSDKNIILSPVDFPALKNYVGKTLITTDGTTLLGADDKAGVAEIMSAVEYLIQNPNIKHGDIKIAFTPDEEIGAGADLFDVKKFNADFAYTVDGGPIGELEYENFNAAGVSVEINGRNIHPGSAKNKMINATLIAMELNSMLPADQKPQYTEGYEGFFHLMGIKGTVENAAMKFIIRDHDMNKFEEKKELMKNVVEFLNKKYGDNTVELKLKDQYYNMKEKIEPVMHIIETAKKAMEECDVIPLISPIRGGTDGARLSFMGLPCPNLFTGGENFHGKYEYVCIESMNKAVEVILKIIELYSKN